jgi:hypothetical protein
MQEELYPKDCSFLVVGDGDLSWSLATVSKLSCCCSFVASTFDSLDSLKAKYTAQRIETTIHAIQSYKAEVLHGIDATNLNDAFPRQSFDRIVFNFPHWGGRGHIERNRKLLSDFFLCFLAFFSDFFDKNQLFSPFFFDLIKFE